MKKLLLVVLLALTNYGWSQNKYATKSGSIQFEASVPSFEPVAAKHENVSAVLNVETGEFAALVLISGFRFDIALMEEHFNENYMESMQFPKAIFKGTLKGFELNSISSEPQMLEIEGSLSIHGVTRPFKSQVGIKRLATASLGMETAFVLKPEEFGITIPSIVKNKVAKEVKVYGSFELKI